MTTDDMVVGHQGELLAKRARVWFCHRSKKATIWEGTSKLEVRLSGAATEPTFAPCATFLNVGGRGIGQNSCTFLPHCAPHAEIGTHKVTLVLRDKGGESSSLPNP